MRIIAIAGAMLALVFAGSTQAAVHKQEVKAAAAAHGWTGYQWTALESIIGQESGFESCRHFPSTTDCRYMGSSACGIPQASPCPSQWRGRLDRTWRAQIRWLIVYVERKYGSPANALATKRATGIY